MSTADDPKKSSGPHVDVAREKIHWDLGESLSYGQYLRLDLILEAQQPLSDNHEEMLFLIIHQASELWMKLCIHELTAAMDHIRRDVLGPAFKMLARISRVQAQLSQSWSVLSTMTPSDYSAFRDDLGKASGFQSFQYRSLEYMIGNKNPAMIKVHKRDPAAFARLEQLLNSPSLYDECLRLLSRRGYDIPDEYIERDWSRPYVPSEAVTAAWLAVYRNSTRHWDLYELAEKLVDLDHQFQLWRFSHLKTVERIIGFKRGTGGSSGAAYLARALELRFFPELWSVRTSM